MNDEPSPVARRGQQVTANKDNSARNVAFQPKLPPIFPEFAFPRALQGFPMHSTDKDGKPDLPSSWGTFEEETLE